MSSVVIDISQEHGSGAGTESNLHVELFWRVNFGSPTEFVKFWKSYLEKEGLTGKAEFHAEGENYEMCYFANPEKKFGLKDVSDERLRKFLSKRTKIHDENFKVLVLEGDHYYFEVALKSKRKTKGAFMVVASGLYVGVYQNSSNVDVLRYGMEKSKSSVDLPSFRLTGKQNKKSNRKRKRKNVD